MSYSPRSNVRLTSDKRLSVQDNKLCRSISLVWNCTCHAMATMLFPSVMNDEITTDRLVIASITE